MFKTIFVFTAIALIACSSYGQNKDDSVRTKKWSMIFEVGTFISNTEFEAFHLSGQYYIKNNFAIRLGMGAYKTTYNGNEYEDIYEISNTVTSPRSSNNTFVTAGINLIYYPLQISRTNFYFGIGPVFMFNENTREYNHSYYEYSYDTIISISETNYIKNRTFGIEALIGAEWFPFQNISIMGEYIISVGWGKSYGTEHRIITGYPAYSNNNFEGNSRQEYNTFNFKFNTVRLGFAIYF